MIFENWIKNLTPIQFYSDADFMTLSQSISSPLASEMLQE